MTECFEQLSTNAIDPYHLKEHLFFDPISHFLWEVHRFYFGIQILVKNTHFCGFCGTAKRPTVLSSLLQMLSIHITLRKIYFLTQFLIFCKGVHRFLLGLRFWSKIHIL